MNFQGIWANIFHIYQPPNWPKKIIDKVVKESYLPLLKFLLSRPSIHITLNITGSLTEQLRTHGHTTVLKNIATLSQRGQLELITTGAHHPIFPLVTNKLIDVSLTENNRINASLFKNAMPTGVWLPELAYAPSLDAILKRHNIEWVILDEIACAKKGVSKAPHRWKTASGLSVLFRHPEASAYFFQPLKKNALDPITNHLKKKRPLFPLVTATDGENLGHHNPHMLTQWSALVSKKNVYTVTISELLELYDKEKTIVLRKASWADTPETIRKNNPYILWLNKNNPIQKAQWQLTRLALRVASRTSSKSLLSLEKILYSDQYWWSSDMPWWDAEVIYNGARLLTTFVKNKGSKSEYETAKRMMNTIFTQTNKHSMERETHTSNIMFGGALH